MPEIERNWRDHFGALARSLRAPARRGLALWLAWLPCGLAGIIAGLELANRWRLRRVATAWLAHDVGLPWELALFLGALLALWAWGLVVGAACAPAWLWLPRFLPSSAGGRELRRRLVISAPLVALGGPLGLMLSGASVHFGVLIVLWSLSWLVPTGLALHALRGGARGARAETWIRGVAIAAVFVGLGLAADGVLGWLGLRSAVCIDLAAAGPPQAMAFAPDGAVLIREPSGQLRRYDLAAGDCAPAAEDEAGAAALAAGSPASDAAGALRAEVGAEGVVRVIADGLDRSWVPHGRDLVVLAVAVRPDGEVIATGGRDNVIRLWRPSGELVRTLYGHSDSVDGLAWSPDGARLASTSADGTLRVWDLR